MWKGMVEDLNFEKSPIFTEEIYDTEEKAVKAGYDLGRKIYGTEKFGVLGVKIIETISPLEE